MSSTNEYTYLCLSRHSALLHFLKTLKRCNTLAAVNLVSSKTVNVKCERELFIPRSQLFFYLRTEKIMLFDFLSLPTSTKLLR